MTAVTTTPALTTPSVAPPRVRGDVVRHVAVVVGALALLVALASAVTGILPETPLFSVVTPLRLVLVIGLVGLALQGSVWRTFSTVLDAPFALLTVVAAWATYEAGAGLAAWRWFLTLLAAYYLTVGLSRRWRHARPTVALAMLVAVACTSLSALSQAASDTSTGFCRRGFTDVACNAPGAMNRVEGTFVNPNLLAAFLVLALPLAALAAWQLGTYPARLVGLGVVGAGVLALLLTLSRAGIIAGVVDLLVLASTVNARGRATSTALRAGLTAALVLVTVAALAVGIGVRSKVWYAALATAYHHPGGVGLGKAGVYITARVPGDEQFAHAHNLWLTWLVETGLIGFASVVAITALVGLRLRRAARTVDPMTLAVGAGLAGYAVACLADDPANITSVALPMMVMLGLAVTAPFPSRGKRALRRS